MCIRDRYWRIGRGVSTIVAGFDASGAHGSLIISRRLLGALAKTAADFNDMLHNARADVVEIDDVVAFFIILIRHVQEEAAAGAAPMEE